MKKLILLSLLMTLSFSVSAKILKIYDTQHQTEVDFNSLIANLPKQGHFILGEYHNSPAVQMAQKPHKSGKYHTNQANCCDVVSDLESTEPA